MVVGLWAVVVGPWTLGASRWSLVVGQTSATDYTDLPISFFVRYLPVCLRRVSFFNFFIRFNPRKSVADVAFANDQRPMTHDQGPTTNLYPTPFASIHDCNIRTAAI